MHANTKYRIRRYLELGALMLVIVTAVAVLAVAAFRGFAAGSGAENGSQGAMTRNPYTPEDFPTLPDGTVECLAEGAKKGIDVSFWQGDIDWQTVRDAGVEFAVIRLGWRSSRTGELSLDENALKNLQGAVGAGMPIGVYFFSQARNPQEAREEAEFVLKHLGEYELDLPVGFDWEYMGEDSRSAGVDARTLTDSTKAFCDTIEAAGYEAMIYFNPSYHDMERMYVEEFQDYHLWLAMYDSPMNYPYKVDFWQYSCTGTVPGIHGDVDLNFMFPG